MLDQSYTAGDSLPMNTIRELNQRASDTVRQIVAAVRPADLGRPTPCADWDLRALLEHMIGQDHGFAVAVQRDVGPEAFAPRPFDGPPAAAHAAGSNAVVAAFAAAAPDRPVLLAEFGDVRFPPDQVVGFHLIDTLVHGWDVAVSFGRDIRYVDDLVAAGLEVARLVPTGPAREVPGAPFGLALAVDDAAGAWGRTL